MYHYSHAKTCSCEFVTLVLQFFLSENIACTYVLMEIITNMHESNPLLKIMWDSVLWTLHNILSSHDKHYCTNDYTCIQNNLLSEGNVLTFFQMC